MSGRPREFRPAYSPRQWLKLYRHSHRVDRMIRETPGWRKAGPPYPLDIALDWALFPVTFSRVCIQYWRAQRARRD